MDQLLTLPGVARKTANVVLGNAFQITSGIVVDTHVSRVSQRLGLTKETTRKKLNKDLIKLVPKRMDFVQPPADSCMAAMYAKRPNPIVPIAC